MSSSPQSTLANLGTAGGSNNGSPSGAQTPMGAKYDAVGDLIYLAAGQVAKLKLNRGYAVTSCPRYLPQRHKQAEISTPSVYLNKPVIKKKLKTFFCNYTHIYYTKYLFLRSLKTLVQGQ